MSVKATYELESDLVKDFESILSSVFNTFTVSAMASEFNYVEGKVDLIAKDSDGDLIAFEAKLFRWRDALHQAYRNSSFTHYSYVVMPEAALEKVIGHIDEFHRRGVGLCFFGLSGLTVWVPATRRNPIQPWLTNTALRLP